MNPSSPPPTSGIWCNLPQPVSEISISSVESVDNNSSKKSERVIDQIDPFLKNPEYVKYEKKISSSERKHRSHKRKRSRSRSREKHRHRRRYRSSSRSRSRSYSRSRRRHDSRERRRCKYSKSRSRSRSVSRSRRSHKSRSHRSHRSRSRRKSYSPKAEVIKEKFKSNQDGNDVNEEDDDEDEAPVKENAFKNDGSFMEMFKKMQEDMKKQKEAEEKSTLNDEKIILPAFGKRRGGKVLKTGMVVKSKTDSQDDLSNSQDAWTLYMKEVKRYKEACCDDDSKTRLLVK